MIKHALVFWTIIILAVFGLYEHIRRGEWAALIFPLILGGLIFWFYKRPPRALTGRHPKVKPSKATMAKLERNKSGHRSGPSANKRKSYPFHVIEGQKKSKNDDELPKYH
ncbi:TcpD family membrane protein [Paenibacillus provencensis]|uniref:TcpD family membrane protein n=1 Tax=Paenibacillus provencensis TaxID=441151 RepID=A0ABW3PYK4_9BACL|nr:TcpD family membrane protein [Paenibacillus sp. MER 78]MCM3126444.1 TcpD family membrane protein [Paenibacillus sp. MER 78]